MQRGLDFGVSRIGIAVADGRVDGARPLQSRFLERIYDLTI